MLEYEHLLTYFHILSWVACLAWIVVGGRNARHNGRLLRHAHLRLHRVNVLRMVQMVRCVRIKPLHSGSLLLDRARGSFTMLGR